MKTIGLAGFATVVALSAMSALVGCAADTEAPFDSLSESDVVGVTDIERLEKAFDLKKDVQVDGKWSRGDDRLTSGECYQEHLGPGAKEPQNWQFRRYTTGAAFFRKLNTGAASGDRRPIACVDSDGTDGLGPMKIDGFVLDAAIRYDLGAPFGQEGAAGHAYMAFSKNAVEVQDADHFCGILGGMQGPGMQPGLNAYFDEMNKCKNEGASQDDCYTRASNACKWWTTIDAQADTMDRPAWGNLYVVGITAVPTLGATQAMIAYKYALAKGNNANVFSLADDPVGTFVKIEGPGNPYSGYTVARYSRLDVHHLFLGGKEGVYVTPKSSDTKIAQSAVASCERSYDANTGPTSAFVCKGL